MKSLTLLIFFVSALWVQASYAQETVYSDAAQLTLATYVREGFAPVKINGTPAQILNNRAQVSLEKLKISGVTTRRAQRLLIDSMTIAHSFDDFSRIVEVLNRSPLTEDNQVAIIKLALTVATDKAKSKLLIGIISEQKWMSDEVWLALEVFLDRVVKIPGRSKVAENKAYRLYDDPTTAARFLFDSRGRESLTDRARAAMEILREVTLLYSLDPSPQNAAVLGKLSGGIAEFAKRDNSYVDLLSSEAYLNSINPEQCNAVIGGKKSRRRRS